MLNAYDMDCLSRFEERWLDPDNNIREEEDDKLEIELLKGDAEWQERI